MKFFVSSLFERNADGFLVLYQLTDCLAVEQTGFSFPSSTHIYISPFLVQLEKEGSIPNQAKANQIRTIRTSGEKKSILAWPVLRKKGNESLNPPSRNGQMKLFLL